MWINQFSTEEVREMIDDACTAFYNMSITQSELYQQLARLGLNATDIEEKIKENTP